MAAHKPAFKALVSYSICFLIQAKMCMYSVQIWLRILKIGVHFFNETLFSF